MMTDGNSQAIAKHLDERDEWDALQEVTVELEQAESDNILLISRIEELEAKLSKSEALLAKAVEALEWQADAIHNSVTVNMKHNHRILLDGIYHEGPLVDWVHKILTGFETINRNTIAELKGETDAE
jgi:hypothetical protein